jgi:hypothetical protein
MKLKNFLIFFIIFSALTLFAEENVILKVFKLPDPKSNEAFNRADMAVVEAFRKKFPHIELRAYSGIELENMEMDAGPLMAIAGGVSPDVIYVNFRQSSTYIEKNFLYPLDDFIAEMEEGELKDRIADPGYACSAQKKGRREGKTLLDAAVRDACARAFVQKRPFLPLRS